MSGLSIVLLIQARTGSFAIAGLAAGMHGLTAATIGPIQGALVDRLGQTRVLVAAATVRAGFLTLLVLVGHTAAPDAALIVIAALAGAALPPVAACARTLWPVVTPDEETKEAAYALDAISQELMLIVGPLIVSACVALGSVDAAVLAAAAMTFGGTMLFATAPASRAWRGSGRRRPPAGALGSAGLRHLLISIGLTGLAWGGVSFCFAARAVDLGARGIAGVMFAMVGVASIAGGLAYGARTWDVPLERRYPVLLLALGLTTVPLALVSSVPSAIALGLLAGPAWAPLLSCQYILVGKTAPDGMVTEAFTWSQAGFAGGVAAGSAVAGAIVGGAGVTATTALASSMFIVASGIALAGRKVVAGSFQPAPVDEY
jgi:hypothetical protein